MYSASDLAQHTEDVDVLVLCGGSATDLPQQTPEAAKLFNVVDSLIRMQTSLRILQR